MPKLATIDLQRRQHFHTEMLDFRLHYRRLDEGFAYLEPAGAELMLDQIGIGRTFETPIIHTKGALDPISSVQKYPQG